MAKFRHLYERLCREGVCGVALDDTDFVSPRHPVKLEDLLLVHEKSYVDDVVHGRLDVSTSSPARAWHDHTTAVPACSCA